MPFSRAERLTIPSPIDVHIHLREPGGTDQETIASGTYAALSGGYQAVFDMPNNPGRPTWTWDRLDEKHQLALRTGYVEVEFYAGVNLAEPDIDQIPKMIGRAAGLKLYFGHTTGNEEEYVLEHARPAIDQWILSGRWLGRRPLHGCEPPILLHAREEVGAEVAAYIASQDYPVHWCHLSTATEVALAEKLSADYGSVFTAGVTPHHLTMTSRDADFKYGWHGARMMPPLAEEADAEALLAAFSAGRLQILETDHAPHTTADKLRAEAANPEGENGPECSTCFGVSGIEFVLPIMMSLVQRNKLEMERLIDALYTQPLHMLGLSDKRYSGTTTIRIEPYVLREADSTGMSSNHPYVGWTAWGKIERVFRYGQTRYSDKCRPVRPMPRRIG